MLIAEAVASGVDLEAVYVEGGRPAPVGVEPYLLREVQDGALDRIGDVAAAQGVLAVASIPARDADDDVPPGLVLVLWDLADPGNVGTMIRAAHASGAAAVLTTARTADVWSPKVVRASAGSLFALPVLELPDPIASVRRRGHRVLAAVVRDGTEHDRCVLTGDVAVLIGNEAHGLPLEVVARADERVTIAHGGSAESLNAAMAATVLLFEALRQRRAAGIDWTSPITDDKVPHR